MDTNESRNKSSWFIQKDHTSGSNIHPEGTYLNAVGVTGPGYEVEHGLDAGRPAHTIDLLDMPDRQRRHFQLMCDDILCYEGVQFLSPHLDEEEEFSPLFDFGQPVNGCNRMDKKEEGEEWITIWPRSTPNMPN